MRLCLPLSVHWRSAGSLRTNNGEQRGEGKSWTHWCRSACAIHDKGLVVFDEHETERLRRIFRNASASRAAHLQSKHRSGQVTAENALVEAVILVAEVLNEVGNSSVLVERARKVEREAAPEELRRDFGVLFRGAADSCVLIASFPRAGPLSHRL